MSEVVRTCIGCRKQAEKKTLHRYILTSQVLQDRSQKEKGRGVYLCDACQKVYNSAGESKEKRKIEKGLSHELFKSKKGNV